MSTRVCRKCHRRKPISSFYAHRSHGSVRHDHSCKLCYNGQAMAWARQNRKRVRKIKQRYYGSHPGQRAKESRAYRSRHPSESRAAVLAAYRKRRAYYIAQAARWIRNNRAKFNARANAQVAVLSDGYIKQLIQRNSRLPRNLIPDDLVSAYRALITLRRTLKTLKA